MDNSEKVMDYSVTRKDLGWGPFHGQESPTNLGLVLHYDGANQHLAKKGEHEKGGCRDYWQKTRQAHIAKGWVDIGYAYGVCPHGYTYTGRGYGYVQAAQKHDPGKLSDGNTRWVSVTLMSGPDEEPTAAQIATVQGLRRYLTRVHGMHPNIRYHGQFSDTDCPGTRIIALVKSGVFGE